MNYQVEKITDVIAEAIPLLKRHYDEIALNKETTPLDPHWQAYAQLDALGLLHVVTARLDGQLVGYSAYVVQPRNLHYKFKFAETDIFYLAPEHRRGMAGVRLLKFSEESLRAIGVERIVTKTKLSPEHDLGPLLERIGFKPIERVYTKILSPESI